MCVVCLVYCVHSKLIKIIILLNMMILINKLIDGGRVSLYGGWTVTYSYSDQSLLHIFAATKFFLCKSNMCPPLPAINNQFSHKLFNHILNSAF